MDLILTIIPAVVAVITVTAAALKLIREFEKLKRLVRYRIDSQSKIEEILIQTQQLRSDINDLLIQLRGVRRPFNDKKSGDTPIKK